MKNVTKLFGIITLVALIGFSIATLGCKNPSRGSDFDGDGNNGEVTRGTLTITNLPYGYTLSWGEVSTTAEPEWTHPPYRLIDTEPPEDDVWNPTVIGYIQRNSGSAANVGTIQSATYVKTNGVWEQQWDYQQSFDSTRTCSMHLQFRQASGVSGATSFGVDNVQLVNGSVTLDWEKDILASSGGGAFPEARGYLTINNIPSTYNGNYIWLGGVVGGSKALYGTNDIQGWPSSISYKMIPISSGQAKVPLYLLNTSPTSYSNVLIPYEGSDSITALSILILADNDGFLTTSEITGAATGAKAMMSVTSGSFSGGSFTVNWQSVGQ